MSTDDLYQEVILDHYRAPRNFGALPSATAHAEGHNPLCGDRVTVYVQVEGDQVRAIRFEGSGCAISTASASVMTDALSGRSRAEVQALFAAFHALVRGEPQPAGAPPLGKLAVFSGVSDYPTRVKCAVLVWHTLQAALAGDQQAVTTE